jgi:hypothetical protein
MQAIICTIEIALQGIACRIALADSGFPTAPPMTSAYTPSRGRRIYPYLLRDTRFFLRNR